MRSGRRSLLGTNVCKIFAVEVMETWAMDAFRDNAANDWTYYLINRSMSFIKEALYKTLEAVII